MTAPAADESVARCRDVSESLSWRWSPADDVREGEPDDQR